MGEGATGIDMDPRIKSEGDILGKADGSGRRTAC